MDGRWRFKHLINRGDETSKIFVQELSEFFDDSPYIYDFYVVIPSRPLQENIASILEGDLSLTLHNPRYSKISNPYNTRYQNSNEWLLNILICGPKEGGDFP